MCLCLFIHYKNINLIKNLVSENRLLSVMYSILDKSCYVKGKASV